MDPKTVQDIANANGIVCGEKFFRKQKHVTGCPMINKWRAVTGVELIWQQVVGRTSGQAGNVNGSKFQPIQVRYWKYCSVHRWEKYSHKSASTGPKCGSV
jgi:hypothetical protein